MARKQIRNDRSLSGEGIALAGLIIGYLGLVASLVFVGLVGLGFLRARGMAKEIQAEMAKEMQSGQWQADSNAPFGEVGMPEAGADPSAPAEAVSGTIKGDAFTYTKSSLSTNMGLLTISDGEDFLADRDVKIFLFAKPGESLENRTWNIAPTTTGMKPHVHLSWQENGQRKTGAVTSGYELELKTGAINEGVITGSLNLKVTGKAAAELRGNFSATVK